ncbi:MULTISPECIES: hypothetical protein [Flavobacterium]|uniref:hypothetical protein n=1 Tax=Flavobacterium TaxID=237 RepID=UPI000745D821|nr:hypothetical protein [Flavobacterium covae]AMA49878.1 hypothetical protein AWN65_10645 [Flavobacterium covae]AND64593.1 hypothetical protein AX766_09270 [Flavobacterium covae]MCJ1810205.1 hypothetical protein [Flavobacterium covae]
MTKIFFEVELAENSYIGFEDLMEKVDYDAELKAKLSKPKYKNSRSEIGRVTVQFFKHTFVINEEYIAAVLLNCYVSAASSILDESIYKHNLEVLYKDYLEFDFIDCRDIGVRIRHFGCKTYENDKEEGIFWSYTNYMIQEIMVPKKDFIEQTIICSEQYFAYLEKVNFPDPHLDSWKNTVSDLKVKFINSAIFQS